jgi:hypothetical protein
VLQTQALTASISAAGAEAFVQQIAEAGFSCSNHFRQEIDMAQPGPIGSAPKPRPLDQPSHPASPSSRDRKSAPTDHAEKTPAVVYGSGAKTASLATLTHEFFLAQNNTKAALGDKVSSFINLFHPNYVSIWPANPAAEFVGSNASGVLGHWGPIFQLISDLRVYETPPVDIGPFRAMRQWWYGHNSSAVPDPTTFGTKDPKSLYSVPVNLFLHQNDGKIDAGWVGFGGPGRPGLPSFPNGYQYTPPANLANLPAPSETVPQAKQNLQDARSPKAQAAINALIAGIGNGNLRDSAPLSATCRVYQPTGLDPENGKTDGTNEDKNKAAFTHAWADRKAAITNFAVAPTADGITLGGNAALVRLMVTGTDAKGNAVSLPVDIGVEVNGEGEITKAWQDASDLDAQLSAAQ